VDWSWTVFVCRVVDGRLGLSREKGKKGEENVTALADYICRAGDLCSPIFKLGQRRTSPPDADLPFTHLDVWYSVRMQMRTTDAIGTTTPQRMCALPSSDKWPFGRYDTILISNGTPLGPGLGGMERF